VPLRTHAAAAPVDWASLNSTQLAAVEPDAFRSLTEEQFATVQGEACEGMQQTQLSNVGSARSGIPQHCMSSIRDSGIPGLQLACLQVIPVNASHFGLHWSTVPAFPLVLISHISAAQWALTQGDIAS